MARELSVELEVVTPLFVGGADQDTPEARATSFRGALRFWWRALAAEADLERLRQREAAVFGDHRHASPVRVNVETIGDARPASWNDATRLTSGRLSEQAQLGLNYLGFALAQRRSTRACLPPGTRLRLTMRLRRGADEAALHQAGAALWLLLNLGGLGTRARRGFGNLVATSTPSLDGLPAWRSDAARPNGLAEHLSAGLARTQQLVGRSATPDRPVEHPIISPRHAWVVVLARTWPSWQAALGDTGALLAVFRRPLYPRLADLRDGGTVERAPDRAAFGLPIQYYHPGTREQYSLAPDRSSGQQPLDRRASPLTVRVIPMGEQQYGVALTVFHGFGDTFLPDRVGRLRANSVIVNAPATAKPLGDFLTQLGDTSRRPSPTWPGSPGLFMVSVP